MSTKLRFLIASLWGVPILLYLISRFGFGFNGLYGQDPHEYYRYALALKTYLAGGAEAGQMVWPVNYPLSGAIISFITGNVLFSLQLVSLASMVGSIILVKKILNLWLGKSDGLHEIYIFLALVSSPFFLRAGLVIMSDMLGIFMVLLSLFAYLRFVNGNDLKNLLLFSFAVGFAGTTRYYAPFVILFPLALGILYHLWKSKKLLYIFPAMVFLGIGVAPNFFFKAWHTMDFLDENIVRSWSPANSFSRIFVTDEGRTEHLFPNIIQVFYNWVHPGFLLVGLFLLPFVRKADLKDPLVRILLACILLYALFLSGIANQNNRFLLLTFPFVVICLFPAFTRAWNLLKSTPLKMLTFSLIVVLQGSLFLYAFSGFYQRQQLEKEMASMLASYEETELYTFAVDMALESYGVKQRMHNMFTEEYKDFHPGALVLFNEEKYGERWAGKNPMINWEKLQSDYDLKIVKQLPGGWYLYKISK